MSEITDRIEVLKRRIAARTFDGVKPLPNFAENVKALQAEIARLEALDLDRKAKAPESEDTNGV